MNQNETIFRVGDSILPTLYFDLIFVEMADPILFTCIDDCARLYLLSCYRADGERREWLVAKCSETQVVSMLSDQITIHDAFYSGAEQLYLLKLDAENPTIRASIVSLDQIPEDAFPTAGYYMEADEGEFESEIQILTRRIKVREGTTVSYQVKDGSIFVERYRVICINQTEPENQHKRMWFS